MSESLPNAAGQVELAESLWRDIGECLESQKVRIYEEIRYYPTPITACDQQFNYLLEEQAKIAGELARMRRTIDENSTRDDAIDVIDAFIQSCPCIDGELEQRVRARLADGDPAGRDNTR
jgi:hypothetical protein